MENYVTRQAKNASSSKPTPLSRRDRSQLRRLQILHGARVCFSRIGFHSTSMAQIAHSARMSVGQIYRHFPSKESLIAGIIEDDINRQVDLLQTALNAAPTGEAITSVAHRMDHEYAPTRRDYVALMLEIAAEAARNSKVRELLLAAQLRGHTIIKKRIEGVHPKAWAKGELDLRLRLVYAVTQGIASQEMMESRPPSRKLLARRDELIKLLLTPRAR